MIAKLQNEISFFKNQTLNFRILVLTNFIYGFVLPVVEIFVAAYIMRNSNDPSKVMIYQLTIYTGIPLTFLINGHLLNHFRVKVLYSAGMLLSGISMAIMMSLQSLNVYGIALAGLTMGLSFGFYWSNRDYLSLDNTNDENRNYYYGLETFLYTLIAVVVPLMIGWFIEQRSGVSSAQEAYQLITVAVFGVTAVASWICFQGEFRNPERAKFLYFKFDPLWNKFLVFASLKGMVQGFLVTAPAMLVMLILGKEGALGTAQSVGAIVSAIIMYLIGRFSTPKHRLHILSVGLILFAAAALINGVLFNKTGVVIFIMLLLIAKPLLDLAYYPIQYLVIDLLRKKEKRTEYAYILNHEAGLYAGRLFGAGTFLILAFMVSTEVALRYAVCIIALVQLSSMLLAKHILGESEKLKGQLE